MKRRTPLFVLFFMVFIRSASPAAAGNLALFEHSSAGHPICGLEGWRSQQDMAGDTVFRLPVFRRCQHLLTTTGYKNDGSRSETDDLLAEVVSTLFDREIISGFTGVVGGTAVLGVDLLEWIPPECEETLRPTGLSLSGTVGPGRPLRSKVKDLASWTTCYERGLELFASEYSEHPAVVKIDRLSRAIDAAELSDPGVVRRLNRLRLALTSGESTPDVAEVLKVLEEKRR